jgi:hypothetical protein
VALNAPVDCVPLVALLPDQLPEAVQEVALLEDQLKVDAPPLTTLAGLAPSDTVAAGAVTGPEGEEVAGGIEFPPPQAASAAIAMHPPAQRIEQGTRLTPVRAQGLPLAIITQDFR